MIYIPNLLTLARIGLVPLLIILLQEKQYLSALLVFLIAGVTDALDGYIAKRFNAITQLGSFLDPLADKALLVSSFVMLSLMELIPFWMMVVVVFRDIIIVCGYLVMVLTVGKVEMQPLLVSKLNTFLQIAFIFIVLSVLAGASQLSMLVLPMTFAVVITSVASGFAYVYLGAIKTSARGDKTIDSLK